MADSRSVRGNPTNVPASAAVPSDRTDIAPHQELRQPPTLTKIPSGFMDAGHRQEMELWIKETNERKFAYIAAVDTREIEIDRELKDNQRVTDEYLAEVLMLIDTARSMMARIDNPNTARNSQPASPTIHRL